ncbi:hypothetical protein FQN49_005749 [Arthroderma sp. PD_2]|nr:hypothetical protein FQN49_005749 [Arthroderma sp. PD_2]
MASSTRLIGALVRRGLDVFPGQLQKRGEARTMDDSQYVLGIAALTVTTLIFLGVVIAIEYTYGMVVATLIMVEDPNPETATALPSLPSYVDAVDDSRKAIIDDKQVPDLSETKGLSAHHQPITSKFRSTILHLRARAGPWSRFRGFGFFLFYSFARTVLTNVFKFAGPLAAPLIADVVTSTLALGWVHAVIAAPSSKSWYQRIPSLRKNWLKIAPAVAISSLASELTFFIPIVIGFCFGTFRLDDNGLLVTSPSNSKVIGSAVLAVVLSLALAFLIDVPAKVVMIRVSASLLPADDETIVPFDRTFDGKVNPADVQGSGKIGLCDAWKTFSWASYRRLLIALVKISAMLITTCLVFGIIFCFEFFTFGKHILSETFLRGMTF